MFSLTRQHHRVFQSTLPVWGATPVVVCVLWKQRISIHAPRVGSDTVNSILEGMVNISIHAPRVGSDFLFAFAIHGLRNISIHAPRVGSDVGGATNSQHVKDFNPRSPCGERPATP